MLKLHNSKIWVMVIQCRGVEEVCCRRVVISTSSMSDMPFHAYVRLSTSLRLPLCLKFWYRSSICQRFLVRINFKSIGMRLCLPEYLLVFVASLTSLSDEEFLPSTSQCRIDSIFLCLPGAYILFGWEYSSGPGSSNKHLNKLISILEQPLKI
jgi:hypothetical protein